ncbi:MAG: DUF6992 family protein [Sphingobacteriales bacterium]
MKKLCTLILIIISCHAFAQQDSLKKYNAERVRITSNGLEYLGGWGLLNLGTGAYLNWGTGSKAITLTIDGNQVPGRISTLSPELKYFGQMNTIWGSVDFVTALLGYTGQQNGKNKKLTAAQTIAEQDRLVKIFKINMYLDVAYLGAGTYLKLVGDSRNSPIMKGYGESVLLQGGFLLLFDSLMLHAEKTHSSKLRTFLEKHPMTFDGRHVGIVFNM